MLKTKSADVIVWPHKFVRYADLKARKIVNNRQTLANWTRDEGFPPGRLLGPNTRVWTEEEVAEWFDARPATNNRNPRSRRTCVVDINSALAALKEKGRQQ